MSRFPISHGSTFLLITSHWYFLITIYVLGPCYLDPIVMLLFTVVFGVAAPGTLASTQWPNIITAGVTSFIFFWQFLGEYHSAFVCETVWLLLCHSSAPALAAFGVGGNGDGWCVYVGGGVWGRVIWAEDTLEEGREAWKSNRVVFGLLVAARIRFCHFHLISLLTSVCVFLCAFVFFVFSNVFLVRKRKTFRILHSNHCVSSNPQPMVGGVVWKRPEGTITTSTEFYVSACAFTVFIPSTSPSLPKPPTPARPRELFFLPAYLSWEGWISEKEQPLGS